MTPIEEALQTWKTHAILREGRKNVVYLDSRGLPTGGIGHLIVPADRMSVGDKITDAQIDGWFYNDSTRALKTSLAHWQEINILTPAWLAALISANFQLGNFAVKFPNSYELLKSRHFDQVVENLRKSAWMRQTPVRVEDFIHAIGILKQGQSVV